MRNISKHWYVFYTKSRHEKKVYDLLMKAGYDVFLPMQKVMRQWSDRKKKVEVPLFNSYIFVKTFEHDLISVLKIPGVAWTILYNSRPAILREEEYEVVQRFITSGLFIETTALTEDFTPGDKAQVLDGPLAGTTGILSGSANQQKLSVVLEGINQVVRVEIKGALLKKI
ncbi:UpxY family transcription antiterminator [Chryseosolibacter indicus]|uniref:UpxY family transcription antiterminator n=1 Tax=Chryseosolibacter indicus TaxID=2782351 RepID=A0ABS5VVP2_9BACT|nr:UpxY family transcription antiterminator [Chryseosolibacter indicus]MBT1704885.1 UpxY family transcription antiterminator [Chryseosolibacter indicus]